MAVLLSGTTIGGHVAVHANNISTYALTSIPATISPTNIYIGNAIYFGGGNNYFNWDGARINSNVGIQSTSDMRAPIFYDSNDTSFYLDPNAGKSLRIAGGIEQNNLVGRPFAQWGQGGAATGAVVIKFPGDANNYGMVHAVVDIYEYNGNNVCTIVIGGHNWGSRWYSYGANMVGFTDKPVRLAFKDGKYAIVIGNDSSSWSYGQVVLRKIQNGSYYAGIMDVASGYTVGIEPESSTWISEDLRGLRVGGPVSATNISTGVTANHIVQRDANGYIYANHINFSTPESENPAISSFITSNGDGWSRKSSLAHVRNQLGNYGGWLTASGGSMSGDIIFPNDTAVALRNAAGNAGFRPDDQWGNTYTWNQGGGYYVDATSYFLRNSTGSTNWMTISGGTIQASGDFRAPIFYDSNDTSYYLDPNGLSRIDRLQVVSNWGGSTPNDGQINIRGQYPSMTFRNTVSNNMWLRHMDGAGDIQHYFAPSGVDATDWSIKHSMRTDGTFQSNGSMRSPIFYDSENTGYYGDFASLSRVNEIGANKMRADTNGNYATDQGWWSHDPYGYGWGKPHGSFRTLEVSSSGDFSNEPAMFRIHQWGSGAAEFWKPKGTILYLRETPGGSSTWFTKFEVQGSQNITGYLNVNGATEHTINDNNRVVGSSTNNTVFINGSIQLTNNNDAIVIGRGTATFLSDEELGFGWGGGWYMTEGSYIRSRGSKSLHMNGGSVDYVGSLYLEGSVGVHLQPNAGSYGSLQVTGSKDGWHGVRFTGSNVVVMANTNEVGFHNNNAGWQFLWSAGTAYVYKGGTGGGTQATVWDSVNAPRANLSDLMHYEGFTLDANSMRSNSTGFTYSNNAPETGPIARFSTGGGYDLWINAGYWSGSDLWFRTRNGDTASINAWRRNLNATSDFYAANMNQYVRTSDLVTFGGVTSPTILVNNQSDNTKGYRIWNTSNTSVSAMFVNSANALVIGAGAFDQVQLNKKTFINGAALGVNVAASATAGRIDASNDIVAYSSSDERLKENIAPIENALDKVKSLTGVEFDWKPEYKHAHGYEGHDTGIIAQQVEAVMPSAVRTNDTGFLAVRYEKLIGLLIEGMKEQQAQIDELKAKLDGIAS